MENFLPITTEQELIFVRLQLEVLKNANLSLMKTSKEIMTFFKSHIEEFENYKKRVKENENAMQAVMELQEKIINKQAIEMENLKKAITFKSLN